MLPVCATCGAQFGGEPPARCPVCDDERQPFPADGQRWTSLEELQAAHRSEVRELEPGLTGIGMEPSFAIGQRLLLVETPAGNVLWDMIPLVDEAALAAVRDRGGAAAIAISHPHYYSGMVEWSRALGGVPILLHEADRDWIMRPDDAIELWSGDERALPGGLTPLRLGGHFAGGTALHWPAGAEGRGALLSGDIVQVIPDPGWVSFMWSYPCLIPLPAREVERIAAALERWEFDRIYGAWWDRVVPSGGKGAVRRSAARYVRAVAGDASSTAPVPRERSG